MIGDLETSCLSLLSRLINYAPLELLIRIRSEAYLAEGISSIIFEISLDLFGAFQLFRRRRISIYFYYISLWSIPTAWRRVCGHFFCYRAEIPTGLNWLVKDCFRFQP